MPTKLHSGQPDPKTMAKALRQALAARGVTLSHGDCLDLVAQQHGLNDWNVLAARLKDSPEAQSLKLPRDWYPTGRIDRDYYEFGLDPDEAGTGVIRCLVARDSATPLPDDSFCSLMQSVLADDLRGQRLRLSAQLRTQDADSGALWMRIDRAPGQVLRFDNMLQRRSNGILTGTQPWSARAIVLDVPEEAATVHFGFMLNGHGRVWARDFDLRPVGMEVATTDDSGRGLAGPSNLDFSA